MWCRWPLFYHLYSSRNQSRHIKWTRAHKETLQKHGVKLRPNKCEFFRREVRYLHVHVGRLVSAGHRLDPSDIAAVQSLSEKRPAESNISSSAYIQNTAARVVTLSRKSCHITPILKELHWLPVSQRIVLKLMLIVHKSVTNIAPIYISELLKVYTPSRNLRSSNMSLLKEPTSKRTWGDRSFSVAATRLWNHLPTKLKSCHSITRFKSLLKTHLMSQFFKDDVYL